MTRVVVDANVYISALVFGGVPQRVLDVIHGQGWLLYISPSIMDEVGGTLSKKFDWTQAELGLFLPSLWDRCIIIKPTTRLNLCADPDDNHVLECAAAAEAEFLITGNGKHFPKSHGTTRVISPRQMLDILFPHPGKSQP
jgi:putative PIN family toxin of toxin-antitoxin system